MAKKEISQFNIPSEHLLDELKDVSERLGKILHATTTGLCWPEHNQLKFAKRLVDGFLSGYRIDTREKVIRDVVVVRTRELPETTTNDKSIDGDGLAAFRFAEGG